MLLKLSFLIFYFISSVIGYNLVIDTHARVIERLFKSLHETFQNNLDETDLSKISDNRRFGQIDMDEMSLHDVSIGNTNLSMVGSRGSLAYQLQITHLKAALDGSFKQKVVFAKQEGNFRVQILDLNATLGLFTLRNIDGMPYIDPGFNCFIHLQAEIVKIFADSKVLQKIAEYRVKDITNKEKMYELLCNKFTDILENFLREKIGQLLLRPKLLTGGKMLYDLEYDPHLIDLKRANDQVNFDRQENRAMRTYHLGISANVTPSQTIILTKKIHDADFTFHIHQELLAEAVAALCQAGYIQKEFTAESVSTLKLTCNGAPRVNVSENQEKDQISVTIPLKAEITSENQTQILDYEKTLVTRLMFQSVKKQQIKYCFHFRQNFEKITFYLRVIKEISKPNEPSRFHYGTQIYRHLIEIFNQFVVLPLPTFVGANFRVVGLSSHEDRLEFAVNLE